MSPAAITPPKLTYFLVIISKKIMTAPRYLALTFIGNGNNIKLALGLDKMKNISTPLIITSLLIKLSSLWKANIIADPIITDEIIILVYILEPNIISKEDPI